MTSQKVLDKIKECEENGSKSLDLSGRGLTEIPESVFQMADLKILSTKVTEIFG